MVAATKLAVRRAFVLRSSEERGLGFGQESVRQLIVRATVLGYLTCDPYE